jgi:large subunit ribosomal protein L27Ae
MRHYHLTRNSYFCPVVNLDKLWTLVPAEQREGLSASSTEVPVIDTLAAGYSKVLGKGRLPQLPCIVKARWVSELAEKKIKEAGGVVQVSSEAW